MPAQIPVLKEGEQDITIIAGVKKNGSFSSRVIYPFYESVEFTREMIPGVVDTLKPITSYRDQVQFVWLEDFEDQTISLVKSGANSTVDTLHIESDPSKVIDYDGTINKYSSRGTLDTGYQLFEFSSNKIFDLPRQGQEIYLEFNYRSDLELVTGIYPITGSIVSGVPIVNFFSNSEWKKAYVSLKEDVNSSEYIGVDFKVFFGALKSSGDTMANVYLDNIKLIHF
ncbi:MAG: hypothetical protein JXR19_00330 [Bacteroidia bacterium]